MMVHLTDGAALWVNGVGAGAPLLVLHGGPGMWNSLEIFDETLADIATVHRYDQRGCGRSAGDGPYTVDQFVADIETLRQHFGYERWSLAGHSWGANLALAYAWHHPERVEKLLYISGVGLGQAWRDAYREERQLRLSPEENRRLTQLAGLDRSPEEEIELLTLSWARDYADRELGLAESRRLASAGYPMNRECNAQLNQEWEAWDEIDLLGRCAAVDAPVLILHGARDPRPFWATDSMLEVLPDVNRIVFEDAGHLPWIEKRDDFVAVAREFIAEGETIG